MKEHEAKLWALIDGVHKMLPLNKSKVERMTGTMLSEKSQYGVTTFYVGRSNPMALSSTQGIVSEVDFRYDSKEPVSSIFAFTLNKNLPCIEFEAVSARYGELEPLPPISPPPLGPNQPLIKNPVFMDLFRVVTPWGRLSFEFHSSDQKKIGCLSEIAFGFNKP